MTKRLVILVLLLSGCAQLRVVRDERAPQAAGKEYKIHSFLWAFIPSRQLPAQELMCDSGRLESLDFGMDTHDVMFTALTFGIYVPQSVRVTCSGAKVHKN